MVLWRVVVECRVREMGRLGEEWRRSGGRLVLASLGSAVLNQCALQRAPYWLLRHFFLACWRVVGNWQYMAVRYETVGSTVRTQTCTAQHSSTAAFHNSHNQSIVVRWSGRLSCPVTQLSLLSKLSSPYCVTPHQLEHLLSLRTLVNESMAAWPLQFVHSQLPRFPR